MDNDDGDEDIVNSTLDNDNNNFEPPLSPALVYDNFSDESSIALLDLSAGDTGVEVPDAKYRPETSIHFRVTACYDQNNEPLVSLRVVNANHIEVLRLSMQKRKGFGESKGSLTVTKYGSNNDSHTFSNIANEHNGRLVLVPNSNFILVDGVHRGRANAQLVQ